MRDRALGRRFRRRACLAVAALGLVGLALTPTYASTVTLAATGLDASNSLILTGGQSDAHWTVDPAGGGTPVAAQTVYPGNADWYGGWAANGPNSTWIARNANVSNNGAAPYSFYLDFSTASLDPSTLTMSGAWTIDDAGTISLNGHVLDTLGGGNWGSLHTLTNVGAGDFISGSNTLAITMTSDDNYLEGVRFEGSISGTQLSATPEPSGMILLLGGLSLLGLFYRSRYAAV